jgi:hypothetical protein
MDRKIEALGCHVSQVGENIDEIAGWVREFSAQLGKEAGFDFAESFRVIAQGPGFHADEQEDDVDLADLASAPTDPRSAKA